MMQSSRTSMAGNGRRAARHGQSLGLIEKPELGRGDAGPTSNRDADASILRPSAGSADKIDLSSQVLPAELA